MTGTKNIFMTRKMRNRGVVFCFMSKEDIVVKLKKVQDELIMDDGLLATDNLSVVKDESDCIVLDFSREIEMIDEVLKEIVG